MTQLDKPATRERKGPIADRLEEHFRSHRYQSFTAQELFMAFPDVKLEVIRNAVRKLLNQRLIKSTGMVRQNDAFPQPQPLTDVVCLTLTIGK